MVGVGGGGLDVRDDETAFGTGHSHLHIHVYIYRERERHPERHMTSREDGGVGDVKSILLVLLTWSQASAHVVVLLQGFRVCVFFSFRVEGLGLRDIHITADSPRLTRSLQG